MSYTSDMKATDKTLSTLLEDVNAATRALQMSATVPDEVSALVDSFDPVLHAEAPLRLEADPYLTTMLFAAAFRAEKALRHDNAETRRRDLRIALEQFRQALRDIVSNRPFAADTPVREVLANAAAAVSVPQREFAELLGVSTRQLQRWLAADGPAPAGDDEARIRIVAQLANQLRHAFTGPGVLAWFNRKHPALGVKPVARLGDPLRYPELLSAASAARSMSG
jgi:hypothetical protein